MPAQVPWDGELRAVWFVGVSEGSRTQPPFPGEVTGSALCLRPASPRSSRAGAPSTICSRFARSRV